MDVIQIKGAGAAELKPLLESWFLTDGTGQQADRVTLTYGGAESMSHIPASGSEWEIKVDGEFRGVYQVSSIDEHLHPVKLVLQLTPAKFNVTDKSGFRESRRRTFPPATVLDVVKAVMEPHGYEVRVTPELASKPTDHLNQNEETDSAFIARLASKHDAIAKPINHMYVFGKRGSLSALSGSAQQSVTVNLQDVQSGTAKIAHPSNVRFSGIKAEWQTTDTGQCNTAVIGTEPYYRMREVFKTDDEAIQRAESKLAELTRRGQTFTATIKGKRGLFAESILNLEGFQSPRSKGNWSIDTVTLSGTRTTYTIQVEATRPT
ncbi:hypothetical protein BCT90_04190 [Vibrio lentus]|uniref:contractile injection system protein, VgrG/Pvc8 family n=1 Tax=Vibrio lentus TaxID=136468 RepID=UPI000C84795F|nr:contractile injection system protein, VgrG/Pvc8 family [Vibrio lentus]PMK93202.1 hypothetical protein BCT90_04190 [Vibrio lentus]